jgi:hypothetical protein
MSMPPTVRIGAPGARIDPPADWNSYDAASQGQPVACSHPSEGASTGFAQRAPSLPQLLARRAVPPRTPSPPVGDSIARKNGVMPLKPRPPSTLQHRRTAPRVRNSLHRRVHGAPLVSTPSLNPRSSSHPRWGSHAASDHTRPHVVAAPRRIEKMTRRDHRGRSRAMGASVPRRGGATTESVPASRGVPWSPTRQWMSAAAQEPQRISRGPRLDATCRGDAIVPAPLADEPPVARAKSRDQ